MSGVAIVTGGSRGIGRATAILLAERGYDLVVNYQANADAAAETVAAALLQLEAQRYRQDLAAGTSQWQRQFAALCADLRQALAR